MLWMLLTAVAQAGVVVGGLAGAGVVLDSDSTSDTGMTAGLIVGWRQDLLLVHVQPELLLRYNFENQAALVGPGAAVSFLSPVAIGGYMHVGLPVRDGPSWDIGALAELTLLPRIRPGIRIGYERAQVGRDADDPIPVDDMLGANLVLVVQI